MIASSRFAYNVFSCCVFTPFLAFAASIPVCLGLASPCSGPSALPVPRYASIFMLLILSATTLCVYLQFSLSLLLLKALLCAGGHALCHPTEPSRCFPFRWPVCGSDRALSIVLLPDHLPFCATQPAVPCFYTGFYLNH